MDRTVLLNRIQSLKSEYEVGEGQLKALQQRERELQSTLLRITGAIQVLEEILQGMEEEGSV